nr:DUF4333 domain-containing protein [Rhodococcus sp. Eu-32]
MPQARALADRAITECDSKAASSSTTTPRDGTGGRILDTASAESGVASILSETYGASGVSAVHCPARLPVNRGSSVSCMVTVDGADRSVSLTFTDDNGTYQVSRPR